MKGLELMLEGAKTISDDKIINAVAFAIRVEAVCNFFIFSTLMACLGYVLYRLAKFSIR